MVSSGNGEFLLAYTMMTIKNYIFGTFFNVVRLCTFLTRLGKIETLGCTFITDFEKCQKVTEGEGWVSNYLFFQVTK